ncbi:MAG: hypothetical protein AAF570_24030, partial [Bacteroidota bacterium]
MNKRIQISLFQRTVFFVLLLCLFGAPHIHAQCVPYLGAFPRSACPDANTTLTFQQAGWNLSNQTSYFWNVPSGCTPIGPIDQPSLTVHIPLTYAYQSSYTQYSFNCTVYDSTNACYDANGFDVFVPEALYVGIDGDTVVGCDTTVTYMYTTSYHQDLQDNNAWMVNWIATGGVIDSMHTWSDIWNYRYDTLYVRWTSTGFKELLAECNYSGIPGGVNGITMASQITCGPIYHALRPVDKTPYIMGPDTVCSAAAQTYSGVFNGDSLVWQVTGGTVVGNPNASTVDVLWNASGQLIATNYDGLCVYHDTLNVMMNPGVMPDLGPDSMLCMGDTLMLFAGNFAGYTWSTGGNAASEMVLSSQTVYVTVADAAGCTGIDSMTATFEQVPVAAFSYGGMGLNFAFTDQSTGPFSSVFW